MLSIVLASIGTGQLISRTGRYKIYGVVGLGISAVGALLLSRMSVDTTNVQVAVYMVLLGLGIGVTMPLFTVSMQAQYPTRIGEVTAAVQFFRSMGGTIGVAALGGVMNAVFVSNLRELVARDAAQLEAAGDALSQALADPTALLDARVLQQLSASLPPQAQEALARFLTDVRLALADGITSAFFWSFLLLLGAFGSMLLVREVSLERRLPATAEEFGKEIAAEEAVLPADQEPVLGVPAAEPEPDALP